MTPDHLADRALPAALRAVRVARRRVLSLARRHPGADPWALVDRIRAELAKVEPQLARILTSATLAGWVLAARRPAKSAMPKALTADEVADYPASGLHGKPDFSGGPVFPDPPRFAPPGADEGGRPVEFPLVRAAVRDLFQRQVVTQREYNDLGAQAKAAAFTVARVATADAVEAVRDAVAETVAQGKTLRQFREDVAGALDGSGLSESQVEAVFRTETARAVSSGLIAALNQPAVADQFPYVLYDFTHDARTRPDHVYLGTHGLDGTGVYRASDPVIRKFFPPCGWRCRCLAVVLTLEDAAAKGVREARRWLASGVEPSPPQYVPHPPFDLPKGWAPPNGSIIAGV